MRHSAILTSAAAAAIALSLAPQASADAVADFFTGKQVSVNIGSDAGGGYDLYARAIARHLGKHIPGAPAIVPKNMPGAGSLKVANFIYNQAAKDGTEIGATQNGVIFEKIFHSLSPQGQNALFDATKFTWLGSANEGVYVLLTWHDTPAKTFEDLYRTEIVLGAPAANTDNYILAVMLDRLLGTKLKLVTGYSGSNALDLAIERGEVQGAAGKDWSSVTSARPHWIAEKKINILVQMGVRTHPDLKGVPAALDLAKAPEDRQVMELIFAKYGMSRPYLAPPGLPADRAKALQAAFAATLTDKEFLADAKKQRLEINLVTGEQVARLVETIFNAPESLAARARDVIKE